MMATVLLVTLTVILVVIGATLHVVGFIGWAQLFYVLASGMAGGAVVMFLENRTRP